MVVVAVFVVVVVDVVDVVVDVVVVVVVGVNNEPWLPHHKHIILVATRYVVRCSVREKERVNAADLAEDILLKSPGRDGLTFG